jgi:hypothetical protein
VLKNQYSKKKKQTSLSAKPKPESTSQNFQAVLSCINQGWGYEYDINCHVLTAWCIITPHYVHWLWQISWKYGKPV